ncbi:hypothetical protein PSPO01_02487 [Paraphaeosphaeria sporulosa]
MTPDSATYSIQTALAQLPLVRPRDWSTKTF